ncbi:hypothetical protein FOA52_015568 [Chlamydomonas sp. UWO 241]|nr:hypothetical protein FOA52_015568 [Chlamydomonas sp. UWO 241]
MAYCQVHTHTHTRPIAARLPASTMAPQPPAPQPPATWPPALSFVNLDETEDLARRVLPKMVVDYYAGGAETQFSLRENRDAFERIKLMPRILRNVSSVDTSTRLLGMDLSFPVIVAPMAMQGMAHEGREMAAARAAADAGIPYTLSTMATSSQEEVASAAPPGANLWFQLYVIRNRDVVAAWVRAAEVLGFKALVVTVDAPRLGKREDDERNRFSLPPNVELKILERLRETQRAAAAPPTPLASLAQPPLAPSSPRWGRPAPAGPAASPFANAGRGGNPRELADARDNAEGSGLLKLFACEVDDSLTWDLVPWLRSITKLPILVKGLLSPHDATLALQAGVDGIIVSNHGGRQLDYSPSALEALPAIVAVVRGRVPIIVDGGFRRGTDVLKAIALGASAVMLGRPVMYGLALGGEAGVARVLRLLRDEVATAMALAGCTSLRDVTPALLVLPPGGVGGVSACAGCRRGGVGALGWWAALLLAASGGACVGVWWAGSGSGEGREDGGGAVA